jgi:hypothetical protein
MYDSAVRDNAKGWLPYWGIACLLIGYVALCAPLRDNLWVTDTLEHQRALRVFAEQWPDPQNPTYAESYASVRYSPYTLLLAVAVWGGIEPFEALSYAAVVNTILVLGALWGLLSVARQQAAGPAILLTMIGLWGAAPGYANSYALTDLPWHQANPSAFSFALAIFAFAISLSRVLCRVRPWHLPVMMFVMAVSMLSHAMTGVFGFLGLLAVTIVVKPLGADSFAKGRMRYFLEVCGVGLGTLCLCLAWPYYSFIDAALTSSNREHWWVVACLPLSLGTWSPPAIAVAACAIGLRAEPLIKLSLFGALICFGLAVTTIVTHSPVLARQPLPGMLFLHIAGGMFLYRAGVFRLNTWPGRLRSVWAGGASASSKLLEVLGFTALLYCLVPQCWHALCSDHLLRAPIASIIGKEDRQLNLREAFESVLAPVSGQEVVLSNLVTNCNIPAYAGRVVACNYMELFVPGQEQRIQDQFEFFNGDEAVRRAFLERYDVRWILLNRAQMTEEVIRDLLVESAVVANVRDCFLLMDAKAWLAAR